MRITESTKWTKCIEEDLSLQDAQWALKIKMLLLSVQTKYKLLKEKGSKTNAQPTFLKLTTRIYFKKVLYFPTRTLK